jgi:hypothetical protein
MDACSLNDEADFVSLIQLLGKYKEYPPPILGLLFNPLYISDITTIITIIITATIFATTLFIYLPSKISIPPLNKAVPIPDSASFYIS